MVIQESDIEDEDESLSKVECPEDESNLGSYISEAKRKSPMQLLDNDSMAKIPTPKEMLQHRFDDVSLEQSRSENSPLPNSHLPEKEESSGEDEQDVDLDADNTQASASSLHAEDLEETKDDDDVDLDLDETVDPSDQKDDEPVQEEDMTRLETSDYDESRGGEDHPKEDDKDQGMTLNSEDSFQDEGEEEEEEGDYVYEDGEEDYSEEEEEEEEDDEYTQLVRQGE